MYKFLETPKSPKPLLLQLHVGGCEKSGPFLGPHDNTAPTTQGTQKGDPNFDNHP